MMTTVVVVNYLPFVFSSISGDFLFSKLQTVVPLARSLNKIPTQKSSGDFL